MKDENLSFVLAGVLAPTSTISQFTACITYVSHDSCRICACARAIVDHAHWHSLIFEPKQVALMERLSSTARELSSKVESNEALAGDVLTQCEALQHQLEAIKQVSVINFTQRPTSVWESVRRRHFGDGS